MILSSREIVDAVLGASPDHKKPPSLSGFEKVCGADNYRDRKRRCEQRFITEGSVSQYTTSRRCGRKVIIPPYMRVSNEKSADNS